MSRKDALLLMMESNIFFGLSPEECIFLEEIMSPHEKIFQKEEVIWGEDEEIQHIGLILSGRVLGEKFYCDGQSHLVHSFGTLDVIGFETIFSSGRRSPITYLAAEETCLLLFSRTIVERQGVIPMKLQMKIKDNMIRILADENIKSMYKLEVLSRRSLRSRIMTFLRIMEKKSGEKTFHIGMDRERFARYLCVNRSALSYELSQMQKDGLIRFEKDLFTVL